MNTTQSTDFREIARNQIIESNPLSDIAIVSLNKVIQNSILSRQEKLRILIEFNYSFSILHHCLLMSKNVQKLQEIDYSYLLMQLVNWYKVNSLVQLVS